jgi:hypothetical protein
MDTKVTSTKSAEDILSAYNVTINDIKHMWEGQFEIPKEIVKHIETECRYKVYLEKQQKVLFLKINNRLGN